MYNRENVGIKRPEIAVSIPEDDAIPSNLRTPGNANNRVALPRHRSREPRRKAEFTILVATPPPPQPPSFWNAPAIYASRSSSLTLEPFALFRRTGDQLTKPTVVERLTFVWFAPNITRVTCTSSLLRMLLMCVLHNRNSTH